MSTSTSIVATFIVFAVVGEVGEILTFEPFILRLRLCYIACHKFAFLEELPRQGEKDEADDEGWDSVDEKKDLPEVSAEAKSCHQVQEGREDDKGDQHA